MASLIPTLLPLVLPHVIPLLPVPARYRNNRVLLLSAFSLYILYTLLSAERRVAAEPTYYELLGLPRSVPDAAVKDGWKMWARRNHPDRVGAGGQEAFVRARRAYDVLSDETKRWAYDRFGPDIAGWKNVATQREYLRRGLTGSVGYYVVTAGVMLFIKVARQGDRSTSFWRHLSLPLLLLLELHLVMLPTDISRDSHPFPLRLVGRLFPSRPQYQLILSLHNLATTLSMALQLLGPSLWPAKRPEFAAGVGKSPEEREREIAAVIERLGIMLRVAEMESARMYHDELRPIRAVDAATPSSPSSSNRPTTDGLSSSPSTPPPSPPPPPPRRLETLLEAAMEQTLIDQRIASHPVVAPVWAGAIAAGRARKAKEEEEEEDARKAAAEEKGQEKEGEGEGEGQSGPVPLDSEAAVRLLVTPPESMRGSPLPEVHEGEV